MYNCFNLSLGHNRTHEFLDRTSPANFGCCGGRSGRRGRVKVARDSLERLSANSKFCKKDLRGLAWHVRFCTKFGRKQAVRARTAGCDPGLTNPFQLLLYLCDLYGLHSTQNSQGTCGDPEIRASGCDFKPGSQPDARILRSYVPCEF